MKMLTITKGVTSEYFLQKARMLNNIIFIVLPYCFDVHNASPI